MSHDFSSSSILRFGGLFIFAFCLPVNFFTWLLAFVGVIWKVLTFINIYFTGLKLLTFLRPEANSRQFDWTLLTSYNLG